MARARVFSHANVSATFDIEGDEENVKRQCLVITNAPVTDKAVTVGILGKSTMHVVMYEYLLLESWPTPLVHRLHIGNRKFCVKSKSQQSLSRHAPPRRVVGFLCGRTASKGLR
jgi:hypothetical protein